MALLLAVRMVAAQVPGPAMAAKMPLPELPERLRLTWPVPVLGWSFTSHLPKPAEKDPLTTWRAEMVLWKSGPLSLVGIGQVDRAYELDCWGTCQAMPEQSLSVQGRLALPLGPRLPKSYVAIGPERVRSPLGKSGRFNLSLVSLF